MKRTYLILAAAVFLLTSGHDPEIIKCVRYKIGITLNDGKYLEGYYFYESQESSFDSTRIASVENIPRHLNLTLYKNVKQIDNPMFACKLNIAAPMDIIEIDKETIAKIEFIGYSKCHKCTADYGYNIFGLGPVVRTDISEKEIKQLRKEPHGQIGFMYEDLYDCYMLSYNKVIGSDSLWLIVDKFSEKIDSLESEGIYRNLIENLNTFKTELKEDDIIMLIFESYYL